MEDKLKKLEKAKESVISMLERTAQSAVEEDVQIHYAPSVIKGVVCSPGSIKYPSPETDLGLKVTDTELGEIFTQLVRDGILEIRVEEEAIELWFPLSKKRENSL